jgi:hypothetical protein
MVIVAVRQDNGVNAREGELHPLHILHERCRVLRDIYEDVSYVIIVFRGKKKGNAMLSQ